MHLDHGCARGSGFTPKQHVSLRVLFCQDSRHKAGTVLPEQEGNQNIAADIALRGIGHANGKGRCACTYSWQPGMMREET